MLFSHLEYLTLAGIYVVILFTLVYRQIRLVTRRRSFWISGVIFCVLWALLERHALGQGWWVFNPQRTLGITLFRVPVEEYVAFAFIHLSAAALLENFRRDELD